METYTLLRQFADSWALLALFAFFIGVVIWVFRPGSSAKHRETAESIFRHDDRPAPDRPADTDADPEETRS